MAGGDSGPSTKTGIMRHFDTMTIMGRRNCTLASFGLYFSLYVMYKIFKKKEK